jgi:hypothetical protein
MGDPQTGVGPLDPTLMMSVNGARLYAFEVVSARQEVSV